MKLIEKYPKPIIDFCNIDCAHDWYNDGLLFFLLTNYLYLEGGFAF